MISGSGLLHFEMNAGKSFLSLCWDPLMTQISKKLGFESEKVQIYAQIASDHQKFGIFWKLPT